MDYFEEIKKIWQEEFPSSGQAFSLHAELIRSIEKLRDEAQRNGNGNRDEGHSMMLALLAESLLNCDDFTSVECDQIEQYIVALSNPGSVVVDNKPYDYLSERVVDLRNFKGSQERVVNPISLR